MQIEYDAVFSAEPELVVVKVWGDKFAPILRQKGTDLWSRAIAWECYGYDQATGLPECSDYQVMDGKNVVIYSAAHDGAPTMVCCAACHSTLVRYPRRFCGHCGQD